MLDAKLSSPAAPSRSQRMIFALLLPVFFALLGLMLIRRPHGLVIAAIFCGPATLATMLMDRKHAASHARGLIITAVLLALVGLTKVGVPPRVLALTGIGFGLVLAACSTFSAKAGEGIYDFYLVFAPLGWLMRVRGTDPMNRKFDKSAASYWIEHDPSGEASRYFRQF